MGGNDMMGLLNILQNSTIFKNVSLWRSPRLDCLCHPSENVDRCEHFKGNPGYVDCVGHIAEICL